MNRKNNVAKKREPSFSKPKFPLWGQEKNLKVIAALTIIIFACSWILIAYFYYQIPPEIPLYYIKISNEALTEKKNLFLLPLGFAFFTLLNFWLAHLFFRKDKILSQLLIYAPLLLNIFLVVIIIKMLYIVGIIF